MLNSVQLQQFLAMGGYAQYVWPAYGVTFLVLIVNIFLPVLKYKKLLFRIRNTTHTINIDPEQRSVTHRITQITPTSSQQISLGLTDDCHS